MTADAGSKADARVIDAGVERDAVVDASAVIDAEVIDAGVADAGVTDGDAQVTRGLCCSASGVTSDCTGDCVPVGVSFERMWPCPAEIGRAHV